MSIVNLGTGAVVWLTWANFKTRVSSKRLLMQYETITSVTPHYKVFAFDGPVAYFTLIYTGTIPTGGSDADGAALDQGNNDTDKDDFEDNYQANANQRIILPTPLPLTIPGYATIATTSFTAIRGTAYVEPSTNAQRSIVSSNANDDASPGGTGARSVRITYYDQTMAGPFTEDINLNGTSSVDLVSTTMCFIESMVVLTAGSSGGNEGTISLKSTTGGGGSTIGSIAPGDNQTQWAHHYIASNKKAHVTGITGSIKGAYGGELHLRKATPTVANSVENTIAPVIRLEPGKQGDDEYSADPVVISGPARLTMYGKAYNSTSMDWQAGLSLYEVG